MMRQIEKKIKSLIVMFITAVKRSAWDIICEKWKH